MKRLIPTLLLTLAFGVYAAPAPVVQFNADDTAQTRCPLDTVVWLNTKTHLYYKKGTKQYANSPQGGFVCLKEAKAAGDKAG
ncbi:MAG TPA: hypothetical protein VGN70_03760 [Gammaproteobacteria bacterium]|jgi:hypothetical protein